VLSGGYIKAIILLVGVPNGRLYLSLLSIYTLLLA